MNDPIKYMIVAGTIAGLSMAAGVVIGAKVTAVNSEELPVVVRVSCQGQSLTGAQVISAAR